MNYSALAKSYNPLSYPLQLRAMLEAFLKGHDFGNYSKYQLQEKINDILISNYEGEEILKYKLANIFRYKKYVGAFEVKTLNSRVDFLVINGTTNSFEVKSGIDSLNRLNKQAANYSDVFEYNTVVVDLKHLSAVEKLLPNYYGIWSFKGLTKQVHRHATYSPNLNPQSQLLLLNKRELITQFNRTSHPEIIMAYNAAEINQRVKNTLKSRYNSRWNFVLGNWGQILPLDIQFFFNTNVSPEIIYT